MGFIFELYMKFNIRTRIYLLGACYSFCIVVAVFAGRSFSLSMAIVSTIVFVVLGFVFCFLLAWTFKDALDRVAKYLANMTDGNLTQLIAPKRKNEISIIIRSIGSLQDTIRSIISQISQASEQLAVASRKLHDNASQISSGTNDIVAQTTTVATASEEMAATSGSIAHNCLMAAETSDRASDTARSGASVVRETIDGMERIAGQVRNAAKTVEELGARSDQIGAIIGTIEDIADQTNLLALNAAIEAARAGEQGRGFAVVADEVRALAERTTKATREIGEMIKAIQKETKGAVIAMEEGVSEVEKGTSSSIKSGEALEMILNQINDVTLQVNQIATAAEEQTATTSEITSNIHRIASVVHTTSQGAAETTAASASLSHESEQLQNIVRKFKLS